jgi:hypothetical protein
MLLEDDEVCKVPPKFSKVDINTHEAQRCCVDCYYRLHAQRHANETNVDGDPHAIAVEELKEGDLIEKFRVTIPSDFQHTHMLKVDLGGRVWTLHIPSDMKPGQPVVVLAPSTTKI